jgi:hypothetical protein
VCLGINYITPSLNSEDFTLEVQRNLAEEIAKREKGQRKALHEARMEDAVAQGIALHLKPSRLK